MLFRSLLIHPPCHLPQLATRISGTSDPMATRGASRQMTAGQRIRRNAMSIPDGATRTPSSRITNVGVKTLDVWRDFVNRRWNAEARFLNLEVSSSSVDLLMVAPNDHHSVCLTTKSYENTIYCHLVPLDPHPRRRRLSSSLHHILNQRYVVLSF